jgi:hypothetical protein
VGLERTGQAHVVYRHHTHQQAPDTTIRSSNVFGILIFLHLPLPPYRIPRRPESEESTFIPRSEIRLNNPLARDTLNVRRTERRTGGDERVEMIMLNLCALSRRCVINAVFGVVWRGRSRAQRRMKSMSARKGG